MVGSLNWEISPRWSAFSRFSYFFDDGLTGAPLGGSHLDGFLNRNTSHILASGITYGGSHWTHEFRFGFAAAWQEMTNDPSLPAPKDSLGRPFTLSIDGGSSLEYGPYHGTDQTQSQRNWQAKYDAGVVFGHHTLRFGVDSTYWYYDGFYPLQINGPVLSTSSALSTSTDPLAYPLLSATFANGQGYLSEKFALGHPYGGVFNYQPALYIHDSWHIRRNVTVNAGLRWFRFSDIVNPDLKRPALLDQFQPGLSRSPSIQNNFAPQLGIAWDPVGDEKTVIRSAIGVYQEQLTQNDTGFDRAPFLPGAIFFGFDSLSSGSPLIDNRTGQPFAPGDPLATQYGFPKGTSGPVLAPLFGQPIQAVDTQINNLDLLYQAASAQAAAKLSGLTQFERYPELSFNNEGFAPFAPNMTTPYALDMNVGVQRELRRGLVFSARYVRVRGIHFPLIIDLNKVGSATLGTFDKPNALAAIAATNASVGCPANASPSSIDCAIKSGASISSYGANGLGAGPGFEGFAFRGENPNFGVMDFQEPIQSSTYNALNLRLRGQFGQIRSKAFSWVLANDVTISYALSRELGMVKQTGNQIADQAEFPMPRNNDDPGKGWGPGGLDRTNMLNFSTITDIRGGFKLSQITHWFTAFPQSPQIPTGLAGCDGGADEIFCSNPNGSGTTGDLLPTVPRAGAFGRDIKGGDQLNAVRTEYNSKLAGTFTPAGQLLVSQGLFSASQLTALGAVMPTLPLAPKGEVG